MSVVLVVAVDVRSSHDILLRSCLREEGTVV